LKTIIKTKGLIRIIGLGVTKDSMRIIGVREIIKRQIKKSIRGSRIGYPTKRSNR
jgi:hypothetical protein